jgi:hypothetical protein
LTIIKPSIKLYFSNTFHRKTSYRCQNHVQKRLLSVKRK